jgi:putative inorganic carbon (HCO3(-)) transporter
MTKLWCTLSEFDCINAVTTNADMQIPIISIFAKNNIGRLAIALFSGVGAGLIVVFLFFWLPSTYAAFCALGLIAPFFAVIVADTKRLLWAVLTICLPVTVDITINHSGHIGGPAGYIISFFDIALAFLYLFWITESIKNKKYDTSLFPEITIPAFCLLGFVTLSIIPSRYIHYSIYEIIELIKFYLAFLYLANALKNKEDVLFIIKIFMLCLLFEGLLGWAQHRYDEPFFPTALGGPAWIDSRVKGTWVSYNDFAWYLTLFLPLSVSMLFSSMKPVYKLICFLALASGSAALLWTRSRASWISFAAATLFVILLVFPKIKSKKSLINTFLAIIAVLILILPLYPRIYSKIYGRFTGSDKGSAQSRIPQFQVAFNIIQANPISGVGINTYSEIMGGYDDTNMGIETITRYPVHNIFLHIASEIGVLGLCAFIWFIAAIFRAGLSYIFLKQNVLTYVVIGLLAGILAHMVHGLVDTEAIGDKLFMFIWFFAGIIMAISRIERV